MKVDVLVAEIGSTTTVVNAFIGLDSDTPEFWAQGQAPTSVLEGDVRIGLQGAIDDLKKKKGIIEKLRTLATEEVDDLQETLHALTKEWNETGHVPFKEKDKIYEEYKGFVNDIYKKLNGRNGKKRLNRFKDSIKERAQEGGNNLLKERERLFRAYENMKSEIQTYENNLGFLNSTSKSGSGLLADIKRKIEKLKDDLELQKDKIAALDEEIRKQQEKQ